MHTRDALTDWDYQVKDMAKAHILKTIEEIATLTNERDLEAGIEELYYQLTGVRLGDPDERAGLWVIIHAVFMKRLLNELKEGGN